MFTANDIELDFEQIVERANQFIIDKKFTFYKNGQQYTVHNFEARGADIAYVVCTDEDGCKLTFKVGYNTDTNIHVHSYDDWVVDPVFNVIFGSSENMLREELLNIHKSSVLDMIDEFAVRYSESLVKDIVVGAAYDVPEWESVIIVTRVDKSDKYGGYLVHGFMTPVTEVRWSEGNLSAVHLGERLTSAVINSGKVKSHPTSEPEVC